MPTLSLVLLVLKMEPGCPLFCCAFHRIYACCASQSCFLFLDAHVSEVPLLSTSFPSSAAMGSWTSVPCTSSPLSGASSHSNHLMHTRVTAPGVKHLLQTNLIYMCAHVFARTMRVYACARTYNNAQSIQQARINMWLQKMQKRTM